MRVGEGLGYIVTALIPGTPGGTQIWSLFLKAKLIIMCSLLFYCLALGTFLFLLRVLGAVVPTMDLFIRLRSVTVY